MCGVFDEVERGLQALDAAEGLDIAQLQAIVDFRGGAGIAQPGTAPAGLVASAPEEADAAGPFPVLRVNDLRPSVDQLRVAPRQPEAGMPYTAEADLSCVQGADITISAERDGQTIAGDFLSSTSDRATISLEVPAGPDEGGVDIVRVAASNPALAQSAQRTLAVDIDRNEEPSAPPPGETPVFNEVREAAFSVSLSAEMERFEPEEGVVIREVRPVNVAAAMLLPQAAFDCFAFDFASRSPDPSMPVPNQFGFLFRGDQVDGGSPATRVVSFVSGLIPSDPPDAACQQLDQLNLSRREEQADDFSIQGEDFFTTLQGVPLEGLVGGGSFNEAQSVRFELMGQAVCDAIKDFEFESADGVFRASGGDTTRCDSASRLEVIFSR